MRSLRNMFFIPLLLALASCASAPLAPPSEDLEAKEFTALTDKGVVYLFRESKGAGMVIQFPVSLDGREIGKMYNGTYMRLELEPGSHEIWAAGGDSVKRLNNKFRLPITVDRQQLYFIKQTSSSARSPRLQVVSKQEGMKEVKRIKLLKKQTREAPTLY